MLFIDRLILSLFIVLIPLCGWCQSKAPANSRLKRNRVTALLNNSRWHGEAFGGRDSWHEGRKYSVPNWFDAGFIADSPRATYSSQKVITDTLTQLLVRQWLHINHIPVTTGMYNLSDSTTRQNLQIKVKYDIMEGEDVISNSYYLSQGSNNWIQILKYDLKSEMITGAFNLKLINQSGRVAYFKNGVFKIRMIYELR